MPNEFTSTTFSEVYKDDYRDSDNYHRILFNSGRPLQARELTQLQTILQTQIQRFADNIFLEGANVGGAGSGISTADYIVLESITSPESYVGVTLQGPSSANSAGLQFTVVHAEGPTDDGDYPILYGFYSSGNQSVVNADIQNSYPTFAAGDTLQDIVSLSGGSGVSDLTVRTTTDVSEPSSIGEGLLFGCQSSYFYVQGHFVYTEKQLIVISKHSATADVDVGFEVKQDIVTVEDTDELYDNQGVVPNLSSPGADRYRIRLVLSEKSSVADPYKFVFYAAVREGEITQQKGGTDGYNEIEKRMAIRHFDTHGNFIVNPWEIRFEPSDSTGALNLKVSGNVKGLNPSVFLDGYRLVNYDTKTITVPKPVSTTIDSGQSATIDYRNYANSEFDSVGGSSMGQWSSGYDLNQQVQMNFLNSNDSVIGSGRIKHMVNTLDDSEGYRIHWYDVKMNPGENYRDVRSFYSVLETPTADIKLKTVDQNLYVVDPEINTSLHEIPGGRVASLDDVVFSVQRQFAATAGTPANNQIQITANANESFDNVAQWIYINTTTNTTEVIPPTSVTLSSGAGNQTATIDVAGSSDNYVVYAYVQKINAAPRTKTLNRNAGIFSATRVSDSGGDRFVFDGTFSSDELYDGVRLQSAFADSANGVDVADQLSFDGGQRDNFYGPIVLKPSGLSADVTEIFVRMDYWQHGTTGNYFSVNSYQINDSTSYSDIPVFFSQKTGEEYDLRNHIDFRPRLNPYSRFMATTERFETPRDGDAVQYDVTFYNNRIDHLAVGYDPHTFSPEIRLNTGVEALQPTEPDPKNNELILYKVALNGNTLSVKDLEATRVRHRRYRMIDIDKINSRVDTLEETVSLSFLEQEAVNLVELNSSGEIRSKTGFFVDDFKGGFNLTASGFFPEWIADDAAVTQSLVPVSEDTVKFSVQPKVTTETINMLFDSDDQFTNRSSYTKSDVVRKGDLILLDYREVLDSSLTNEVISWFSDGRSYEEEGWYNVNPFNVFRGEGVIKISPQTDVWHEDHHLPDINIVKEETQKLSPVYPPKTSGSGSYRKTGTKTETTIRIDDIQEDVVAYAVPFARQREIFIKAQGLRPDTRYWPFFDEVNVEQWCLSETQQEYRDHLAKNEHLKGYPEVDVTVKKHPRRLVDGDSVLITNARGELYLSFWLPNNAPLPSPSGNEFSTYQEWENWIEEQERLAASYGNSKDPRTMDQTGWKFRSGTLEFLLNDVSVHPIDQGLSHARTQYISSGSINVSQKTIYSTRVTTYQDTYKWVPQDPLAQSFTIDGRNGVPGAFVTKVQVFMRKAPQTANRGGNDLAIPLQLQIREVEAGVPKRSPPNDQFRAFLSADEVYDVVSNISDLEDIDDVLSNPVTFELEEPVYLAANEEYAIVLMADCDNYEAFISTTYGLILGKTDERVSKQPATGSLFLSQNGSTWTPRQDQNLAYRIYTAKFKNEGSFNFYNDKYQKYYHNNQILSVDPNDRSRYRVNHLGHGLGVGDRVGLTGLDATGSYFGLTGATLMDSTLVVDSADTGGYFVQLADSFDDIGWFGADSAQTNQAMNYDWMVFDNQTQNFAGTRVDYTGSFITGVSHSKINTTATADPRFSFSGRNIPLSSQRPIRLSSPRMLANPIQELDEIATQGDSSPSIVIGTRLKSSTSSTFGGPSAAAIRTSGYVSDVSPIVDLQRAMVLMDNFLIDNQPTDSAGQSDLTNTPAFYMPETHPTLGSSPSKHTTKPVMLDQPANGIRVISDIHRPPSSSIELYYRTVADTDDDIYEESWTLATLENNPPANQFSAETYDVDELVYHEYSYLIGGEDGTLPDFTKFQLKIVMKSTNTSEIPTIKSIRAIAVI
jgi:hypothetical protein